MKKKTEKLDLPKVQPDIDTAPGSGSIYLKKIVFEGGSVFPSAELEKLTADYLNRWVRAADIEAIRRKVSQYYIDHGYINSGAILESQSLADGALKVNIPRQSRGLYVVNRSKR